MSRLRQPRCMPGILCLLAVWLGAGVGLAREVRVGVFQVKPMVFTDETGSPAGIYVDIIRRIARDEGWDLVFVEGSWKEGKESFYYHTLRKWLGGEQQQMIIPRWVFTAGGAAAGMVLWMVFWVWMLKKQVAQRTAALAKEERKFRSIFNNSFHFTGLLDAQGRMLSINRSALDYANTDEKDVMGQFFWDTPWCNNTPENRHLFKEKTEQARAGRMVRFKAVYSGQDNSPRTFDFSIKPVFNETGRVDMLIPEGRDVTEMVRAQERYQTLFNMAGDAVLIFEKGVVADCNAQALKIFSCRRDELLGTAVFQLFEIPGGEHPRPVAQRLARAEEGQRQYFQGECIRPNGMGFQAEVALDSFRMDGGVFVQALIREKNDQLRSESERMLLMQAIEQIREGIMITDREGGIQYVNSSFSKISGFSRGEMIRQKPSILKSGQQSQEFYEKMWETLLNGDIWSGNLINKRKNGELYTEENVISPIRNPVGQITNFIAIKRDITRELEMEYRVQQGQKMEAIGTLAGGIAHDFNNILAGILGFAEMGREEVPEKSSVAQCLDQIVDGTLRAKSLVKQILTFSRKEPLLKKAVPIHRVLKEALGLIRSSIPLTIHLDEHIETEACTYADETHIHQIIMNLCTNAFQAMEGKSGKMTVKLCNVSCPGLEAGRGKAGAGNDFVLLEVADEGCGMDEDTLAKAFEPYFTTKVSGQGTGLGLAVTHGIVTDCGGRIDVQSKPGEGTTVRVYLPKVDPDTVAVSTEASGPETGDQKTVLIVDDEDNVLAATAQMVRRCGCLTVAFRSSSEALQAFKADPEAFDLVITDLTMPGKNGLELGSEILAEKPGFPVIMITGFSEVITREKALAAGFCDMLNKPFGLLELKTAIRDAFARCAGGARPPRE